jgi:hypothetical protein
MSDERRQAITAIKARDKLAERRLAYNNHRAEN